MFGPSTSLLAVRSKFFPDCSMKYDDLPSIKLVGNMFIKDHRDCAAVDFWMYSHSQDGTLVPPSPPTSSEVYKVLVKGVYLEKAAARLVRRSTSTLLSARNSRPPSRRYQIPHRQSQQCFLRPPKLTFSPYGLDK